MAGIIRVAVVCPVCDTETVFNYHRGNRYESALVEENYAGACGCIRSERQQERLEDEALNAGDQEAELRDAYNAERAAERDERPAYPMADYPDLDSRYDSAIAALRDGYR